MPNHVTNKLTITGLRELLQQFADQVKGTDVDGEESEFTLHRVIPQPEVLTKAEESSNASLGLWLVDEELHKTLFLDDPMNRMVSALLKTPGKSMPEQFSRYACHTCASREEARAWAEANQPKLIELGAAVAEAYREYGHRSWYGWRIATWGTKWDAYRVTLESEASQHRLVYFFDTAWSPPSPVIVALAEKFPSLVIEHKFFDEMHNFWGTDLYQDGRLAGSGENLEEDHDTLCIEVLGYDPAEDAQEEENTLA